MNKEINEDIRLTVRPKPKPGESLSSYIARTADHRFNHVEYLDIRKYANNGPNHYLKASSFMHQLDWLPQYYDLDRLSYILGLSTHQIISLTFNTDAEIVEIPTHSVTEWFKLLFYGFSAFLLSTSFYEEVFYTTVFFLYMY